MGCRTCHRLFNSRRCIREEELMVAVQLSSSAINQVEYHKKNHVLDVYFTDGNVRNYKNVPEKVYQGLILANSAGKFFNYNIRDIYQYS